MFQSRLISKLSIALVMEPSELEKPVIEDRAVQIQTGAIPLEGANVQLGLLEKPDPMQNQRIHALVPNWTLSQILSTRKDIGTFTISVSTPTDKPVWSFRHTMQNVVDLHMRTLKDYFRIWRWNLHFHFEIRSNFQQVGQILIVNHTIPPRVLQNLVGRTFSLYGDYFLMTQLPHRKIMMGEDVDVHMTCQWDAPIEGTIGLTNIYGGRLKDGSLVSLQYDMGEIFLIAPFQMQVGQNVNPSLTVKIWSYITDLGMSAYSPYDKLV